MAELPFVSAKHVPKLALQRAALETSDVRLTYPFYRSTTDAVFSGFEPGKLYSALIYIMFDLFPNARFGADLTPQYLVQYIYDRMRFLLIELRKIDQRADELFLPFVVLLAEYQKSLYNAASSEQIHELYQATNNWLFLRDNVYLNTNARAGLNLYRIQRLEAENDQERLRDLALGYFRSSDVLLGAEALHALGRVRLASALGGFACGGVGASRVEQILYIYSLEVKTPAPDADTHLRHSLPLRTRARWAACEMYLSDPAFGFLRSRAFIANETWKGCDLLYNIAQRAGYDNSAAWGAARPLVPQNLARRAVELFPVKLGRGRPLGAQYSSGGSVGAAGAVCAVSGASGGAEGSRIGAVNGAIGGNQTGVVSEDYEHRVGVLNSAIGGLAAKNANEAVNLGANNGENGPVGPMNKPGAEARPGQAAETLPGLSGLPELAGLAKLDLNAFEVQAPERAASEFAFGAVSTARPQLPIDLDVGSAYNASKFKFLDPASLQMPSSSTAYESVGRAQPEPVKWAFSAVYKPAEANPVYGSAIYGSAGAMQAAAKPWAALFPPSAQSKPTYYAVFPAAPEHGESAQQRQFSFALNGAAFGAFYSYPPAPAELYASMAAQPPFGTFQAQIPHAEPPEARPRPAVPAPTAENKLALRQLLRELKKQYVSDVVEDHIAQRRHERRLREMVASLYAEEQALASARASYIDEPAAKPAEFTEFGELALRRSESTEFSALAFMKSERTGTTGLCDSGGAVHLEVINRFWPLPDVLK